MSVLLILCLVLGIYLYLTDDYVEVNKKVAISISKDRINKDTSLEKIYKAVNDKIYSYINISEEKERQLEVKLKSIGSEKTPKEYIVYGYSQSIVYIVMGLIVSIISMNFKVLFIFLFISYYNLVKREKEVSEKFSVIQEEIEKDLPKFCSVITSKLNTTKNVENIIQAFYPIANERMKEQLEITLADIRTGNVLKALERFENRIRSPHLSDITRGLRAVHNGDNQIVYFSVKQQELNKEYRTILEKEVDNRPSKLRPLQGIVVGLFILSIIYPMLASIGGLMTDLI